MANARPDLDALAARDQFAVDGPTCISFSGGRTSAYMLWRVLQSNGGKLPDECVVCFANTGKEDEATLRFVQRCSEAWSVPIVWLEYLPDVPGYKVVDFDSASRDGEPFEAIILKRNFLPNPVTRFCTTELKIRIMHKFLRDNWTAMGWGDLDQGVDQMIGIRADEMRRVTKIRARGHSAESAKDTMLMPLADANVTLKDIEAFWAAQPFGLELPTVNGRTPHGNCDLCFLKNANQVRTLIAEKPERAIWWARMETLCETTALGDGGRFRKDRPSYAAMLKNANDQADAFGFDNDEEAIACFCGE